jgi:hypothetical protein
MVENPKTNDIMMNHWSVLRQRAWGITKVREHREVIQAAMAEGINVQIGRVHSLCVEINCELPEGHPKRRYESRIVFAENNTDHAGHHDRETVPFPDLTDTQTSLENQRLLDCYGACSGNAVENADVMHIYLQVPLTTPCWVELPAEAGPGGIWGPTNLSAEVMGLSRTMVKGNAPCRASTNDSAGTYKFSPTLA